MDIIDSKDYYQSKQQPFISIALKIREIRLSKSAMVMLGLNLESKHNYVSFGKEGNKISLKMSDKINDKSFKVINTTNTYKIMCRAFTIELGRILPCTESRTYKFPIVRTDLAWFLIIDKEIK